MITEFPIELHNNYISNTSSIPNVIDKDLRLSPRVRNVCNSALTGVVIGINYLGGDNIFFTMSSDVVNNYITRRRIIAKKGSADINYSCIERLKREGFEKYAERGKFNFIRLTPIKANEWVFTISKVKSPTSLNAYRLIPMSAYISTFKKLVEGVHSKYIEFGMLDNTSIFCYVLPKDKQSYERMSISGMVDGKIVDIPFHKIVSAHTTDLVKPEANTCLIQDASRGIVEIDGGYYTTNHDILFTYYGESALKKLENSRSIVKVDLSVGESITDDTVRLEDKSNLTKLRRLSPLCLNSSPYSGGRKAKLNYFRNIANKPLVYSFVGAGVSAIYKNVTSSFIVENRGYIIHGLDIKIGYGYNTVVREIERYVKDELKDRLVDTFPVRIHNKDLENSKIFVVNASDQVIFDNATSVETFVNNFQEYFPKIQKIFRLNGLDVDANFVKWCVISEKISPRIVELRKSGLRPTRGDIISEILNVIESVLKTASDDPDRILLYTAESLYRLTFKDIKSITDDLGYFETFDKESKSFKFRLDGGKLFLTIAGSGCFISRCSVKDLYSKGVYKKKVFKKITENCVNKS